MNEDKLWTVVRQRAGPLVKECRYWRTPNAKGDLPSVRREKNEIRNAVRNSCFARTPRDRLELRLALMGCRSTIYTLTFAEEHLPKTYRQVQTAWKTFLRAMRRYRERPFDYVYIIEGKHGDHRFHIHLILRDKDFKLSEVQFLWGNGSVTGVPMMAPGFNSFYARAEYFTKEQRDGMTIPLGARFWSCSQSLNRKLPPPQKTKEPTGRIAIPEGARCANREGKANPFGSYRYASYIYL